MRSGLGSGQEAGPRRVPTAMRSPFDDGDAWYRCHLGFESTDTVQNSAGDRGCVDGGTIPEDTFDWSVGQ